MTYRKTYTIRPTMTPKRRAWLTELKGVFYMPLDRCYGRRRITHDCLCLGWTEWAWQAKASHKIINHEEAMRLYGDRRGGLYSHVDLVGIRITTFGRQALRENPA